jgi:predicted nucleic acid-binding protein
MQVLFDTNLVLDVMLEREPWLAEARALWQAHEAGQLTAHVAATTLTNIAYIARRLTDGYRARQAVQVCLDTFEIISIDRSVLEAAQQLSGSDFEDNVQIASAETAELDAVVTRDVKDFQGSPRPVWSPAECLRRLAERDADQ